MRDDLTALFDEVRLLEHVLVRTAEALHRSSGISVPGRAVLEYLERHGPTTVPDIARARYVTRQHIQVIVDTLIDQGFVTRTPNPSHQSSPLIALTATGSQTIAAMHKREQRFLDRHLSAVAERDVRAATKVLAAVRGALNEGETS